MASVGSSVSHRPCMAIPVCGLVIALFGGPARGGGSDSLQVRFLKEAPSAWREYRDFAERLQGSLESTMTVEGGPYSGKPYSRSRLEFKSNDKGKFFVAQWRGPTEWGGTAEVSNVAYAFTLTRKTEEKPWVLANLRLGPKQYNPNEWERNRIPLLKCISPGERSLLDLVRQPTFRVLHAKMVQRDDTELVQIEFDNTHPWNAKPYFFIQGGTLFLDPNRKWTIRNCAVRFRTGDGNSTWKEEYEFRDPAAKYPIPKRSVSVHDQPERKEGRLVVTAVKEYDVREVSSLPTDEEFTLSAFGLPEPKGVSPVGSGGSRWYLWFLAVAVLCLALGAYFWRRVRRQKMTTAQAT